MLSEWLRAALEAAGKSQSDLSRVLTAQLGRSIDRAAVNKMASGSRAIAADELIAMATYLNAPMPPGIERRVPLKGFVGAGQEVYQFDEDGAGDVEAPPNVTMGTVAVEVRGESMLPLYEDGTMLFYSRQLSPEEMVGRRCVVMLEDERVLVKTLRRGAERGLYSLLSLNAPDIEDVTVQWAAPIDWIKPR
jgi:transcriptional regulator with XRE-family HTH domain